MHPPLWVRDYIGIPFVAGGRDREGADCWGLFAMVMRNVGHFDVPMYDSVAVINLKEDAKAVGDFIRNHTQGWAKIAEEDARPLDGLLLRWGRHPIHVSVVIGSGEMLHTEKGIDSCRESYKSPLWSNRIVGVYRHESHTV